MTDANSGPAPLLTSRSHGAFVLLALVFLTMCATTQAACGPEWWDGLVADKPLGFNFDPCCVVHDSCYDNCGGRSDCDNDFHQCMVGVCGEDLACKATAKTYYTAVDKVAFIQYPPKVLRKESHRDR
jgi:hypothetical protein